MEFLDGQGFDKARAVLRRDHSLSIRLVQIARKQVIAFNHILSACQSVGGRTLSIHSRHAASKVLDCLEAYPDAGVPILHWFSGSPSELRRAIAVGCWFSVGRPMTKSAKGVEHLKSMPRDRILTETDAPFASAPTDTFRDLETTVKALADVWACSSDEAADQLKSNLRHLAAK
nr:TatD family hydrolase [Neorhizobium tomejilense]